MGVWGDRREKCGRDIFLLVRRPTSHTDTSRLPATRSRNPTYVSAIVASNQGDSKRRAREGGNAGAAAPSAARSPPSASACVGMSRPRPAARLQVHWLDERFLCEAFPPQLRKAASMAVVRKWERQDAKLHDECRCCASSRKVKHFVTFSPLPLTLAFRPPRREGAKRKRASARTHTHSHRPPRPNTRSEHAHASFHPPDHRAGQPFRGGA